MPQWIVTALFFVFVVHLVIFGRKWWQQRTLRLLTTTSTFVLLVLSFGLRLVAQDVTLLGVEVSWPPRVLAWGTALLTLALWLRERRTRVVPAPVG